MLFRSPPKSPTIRLYLVSSAAGALEPCGCVKDMLGGVDHAAAFVKSGDVDAPFSLTLGAGPMFVALTQTASALPFFLFALPAGAIGDIVGRIRRPNRRRWS